MCMPHSKANRSSINIASVQGLEQLARELLLCIVLPGVLLVNARAIAQQPAVQQHSDDQIANAVNSKLMASDALRPLDLGVWVHHGVATLSGNVPSKKLQQEADSLVRSIAGVQSVDDQLTVGTQAPAPRIIHPNETNPNEAAPIAQPGDSEPSSNAPPAQEPMQPATPSVPPSPSSPAYGSAVSRPPANYPPNAGAPPPAYSQPSPSQGYARQSLNTQASSVQNTRPMVKVPQGAPLYVMVMQTIDSHHTQPGTGFHGVLVRDLALSDGVIAIPRGASVDGTVIDARPPGHFKGRPKLALQLSNVNVGNRSYVLTSDTWAQSGPGKGVQTAGSAASGAAFGAVAGAIAGGGPIALLGAAIGGLGGAGLSALSPGAHLVIPSESVITFRLNAPLTVQEPTPDEVRRLASNVPRPPGSRQSYRRHPPPYPYPYYPPPYGYPY